MNANNVKMNPKALQTIKKLDDITHGINASGTFALLVLHMNGDNIAKIPMAQLIKSDVQKAKLAGVRLNTSVSVQDMVDKTLKILVKNKLIIPRNLPLGQDMVCYKINPDMAQF